MDKRKKIKLKINLEKWKSIDFSIHSVSNFLKDNNLIVAQPTNIQSVQHNIASPFKNKEKHPLDCSTQFSLSLSHKRNLFDDAHESRVYTSHFIHSLYR